ncbi:hypothetical protein [Limnothrix redekei]|uniref:HNH endonuclease n=1 Tax=Limnothrix redekei LRLZ20PSL1 TaxID=3112953 RepID=A0ABW7C939_9CYAN
MKEDQCYCCNEIATTKDHIPPKCFFPEIKYFPDGSPDYRSQLVTVPACKMHNNSRSADDEYTAAIIFLHSRSEIALAMLDAKWIKVMSRRESSLGRKIFSAARLARTINKENGLLSVRKTLAISYDIKRIENVIEAIARALYFHDSDGQDKWMGNCVIRSPHFRYRDLKLPRDDYYLNQVNQVFIYGENKKDLSLERKGANPDVFYYQLLKHQDSITIVIRMVFYGDIIFFAFLK